MKFKKKNLSSFEVYYSDLFPQGSFLSLVDKLVCPNMGLYFSPFDNLRPLALRNCLTYLQEMSATQFIRARLGEQHLEYSTLIPLTFIYGSVLSKNNNYVVSNNYPVCRLFLVLGVLGNLATCIVILRNEYMRQGEYFARKRKNYWKDPNYRNFEAIFCGEGRFPHHKSI